MDDQVENREAEKSSCKMPPWVQNATMPAAVAIKISPELAELSREEAAHTDRSLTGQVEHWAKLGRVVEHLFPAQVVTALKRSGGDLNKLEEEARKRVLAAIETVHSQAHFSQSAAKLMEAGGPRYEADPANSEGIIQVWPDGRSVPGRMVSRRFVAAGS